MYGIVPATFQLPFDDSSGPWPPIGEPADRLLAIEWYRRKVVADIEREWTMACACASADHRLTSAVRSAITAAAAWLRDDRNREKRNAVAHPEGADLVDRAGRVLAISATLAGTSVAHAANDRLLRGLQLAGETLASVRRA